LVRRQGDPEVAMGQKVPKIRVHVALTVIDRQEAVDGVRE